MIERSVFLHLHGDFNVTEAKALANRWVSILSPETVGRLLLALDDFINPKIGKNIFGCERTLGSVDIS